MAEHPTAGGVAAVSHTVDYPIVVEWGPENYSAYAPDVPGCVATGATAEECEREMREALALYAEVAAERGEPMPPPRSRVATVAVLITDAA